MVDLDDLDAAYLSASTTEPELPAGDYAVRVVGVEHVQSATKGTHGLRLRFAIDAGPLAGRTLRETYWMSGGALSISKRNLEIAGFMGMKPSEILAFRDFARLPRLAARVRIEDRDDHSYVKVHSLFRLRAPGTDT